MKIRWMQRLSIRNTLMMFMLSVVFLLCLIVFANNDRMIQKLISEYVGVWSCQIMEGVTGEVNAAAQHIEHIVNGFASSSALNRYIREDAASGGEMLSEREAYHEMQFVKDCIGEFYTAQNSVPFVCIRFHGRQYCIGEIARSSIYDGLDTKIEEAIALADTNQCVSVYLNGRELQLLARRGADLANGRALYDIVLALDVGRFSSVLADGRMGDSGQVRLVNANGENIYPPSEKTDDHEWAEVKQRILQERLLPASRQEPTLHRFEGWQIVSSRTKLNNWYLVGYTLADEITATIFNPFHFWIVPALAMLFTALFCVMLSRRISRPITRIVSVMKKAESSNFTDGTVVLDESFRETAYISNQFNEMMSHIRRLLNEIQKAEMERSAAELASLQAQIRPHFIYNTLENINMALIVRGQDDISQVVMELGEIMRYNINPKRKEVCLYEDVEQVEKYLHIQQFRFGGKLNYTISIAPETAQCMIEKLLIQPLVENSVIHGIGARPEGGTVWIESWLEDEERLCIRVADDGIGFDPNAKKPNESVGLFGKGGHIGLDNVRRRIAYQYGDAYGLCFEKADVGASIVIILPVVRQNEEGKTCITS